MDFIGKSLFTAGLACLIGAIVGGGLKAFGVELPLLQSRARQLVLGALGAVFVLGAIALSVKPEPPQQSPLASTAQTSPWQGPAPSAPATIQTASTPATAPSSAPSSVAQGPSSPASDTPAWAAPLLEGVKSGWVVTENPNFPGKLFVHRQRVNGMLIGLMYYVQDVGDSRWTVYDPYQTQDGPLGRRLGSVAAPEDVDIGTCACIWPQTY